MHLEVISFSIVVRSPLPLPTWSSPKDHPYPGQFTNIFCIRHLVGDQYQADCSMLSVFTVACDLSDLAALYAESMSEINELATI